MSSETMPGEGSPPSSRLVRLSFDRRGHLIAAPISRGRKWGFEAFPLPRLPLSTLRWCSAVARLLRCRSGVCLAVVLLVDRDLRRWFPVLPTQTCSEAGISWPLLASDYTTLSSRLLIAGSFQSLMVGGLFEAAEHVPTFDGVHVIEQRCASGVKPRRGIRSRLFLRLRGGEPTLAEPSALTVIWTPPSAKRPGGSTLNNPPSGPDRDLTVIHGNVLVVGAPASPEH
jgi:hypothetical protein